MLSKKYVSVRQIFFLCPIQQISMLILNQIFHANNFSHDIWLFFAALVRIFRFIFGKKIRNLILCVCMCFFDIFCSIETYIWSTSISISDCAVLSSFCMIIKSNVLHSVIDFISCGILVCLWQCFIFGLCNQGRI